MESLSETQWDVVISGTGLQQSLVALALSRSGKKVLHVDQNDYYGGAEAAFSLQDVDEWVKKVGNESLQPFRNASLWKSETDAQKLSFSRAYTLALSSQIIYTKSKLISQLVSSKVYRQLEFQAVGNWWIYHEKGSNSEASEHQNGTLQRLPNGREDIFTDDSIDLRSKRSLMKFLKFVVDYENQPEVWEAHAKSGLPGFLSSQFKLPSSLQTTILALTLSLKSPEETPVEYALPRIARHLTSIGVFGPGFGAVIPKWGGSSEIAQVACRAGAVGGGVYVLGTGVKDVNIHDDSNVEVALSNDETVKARSLIRGTTLKEETASTTEVVAKTISIVSSPLTSLFTNTIEGAPTPAVSVVVLPSSTFAVEGSTKTQPVYIMVHSSETGGCPSGQCVLYATTLHSAGSKTLLDAAISAFIKTFDDAEAKILYNLYYEQKQSTFDKLPAGIVYDLRDPSLDLAFDDTMLKEVENAWGVVLKNLGVPEPDPFLQFEERNAMEEDEDGY